MNNGKWRVYLATLGPVGYMTAPGTMATLMTVPCIYWLRCALPRTQLYGLLTLDTLLYGIITLFFVGYSFLVITKVLPHFGQQKDPSAIVLDEVVGTLVTFLLVPLNVQTLIIGVLLFRFFDITKFAGVGYMERFNGAWGVLLDDVLAGALSCFILHLLF